jgi:hypothetical protein
MSLASEFLKHGAVTQYRTETDLAVAAARLREHGYIVHDVDASSRKTTIVELTRILRFKERFGYAPWGGNLDALADAMYDLQTARSIGVVFAFHGPYAEREFVENVLEVLSEASAEARARKEELIVLALDSSDALEA